MNSSMPQQLSQTAYRARAAAMIRAATDAPALTAQTVADLLDAASAAILHTAGLTDDESRAVLAALWCGLDRPIGTEPVESISGPGGTAFVPLPVAIIVGYNDGDPR